MHIMEGYLDPIWCAVWYVLAIPFVVLGARAIVKLMRQHPEQKMTVALSGAFIFLLSSLKLPSATGTSSHPTGTGLSAVLYGISATAFLSTIVLLFQAILLAHGGITTLGANVFSMGIFGPLCGILIWTVMRKAGASIGISMFGAAVFADLCTYVLTSFQMALNWGGLTEFLTTFAVTQIPVSIIEGILFYMFANYLLNNKPEVFETAGGIIAPKKDGVSIDEIGYSKSGALYIVGMTVIVVMVIGTLAYGYANGFEFGGADGEAGGIVEELMPGFTPWFDGLFGGYELPGETESLLFALQAAIGALLIGYVIGRSSGRKDNYPSDCNKIDDVEDKEHEKYYYRRCSPSRAGNKVREESGRPIRKGRHHGSAEHVQMDTLAYSSRMLEWSPLGKLLMTIAILVVNVLTDSVITAIAILIMGIALMFYSTNMRVPRILLLAIGEALMILIIACGIISVNGNTSDPCIWSGEFLWMDFYMTSASFNQAWLVLIRAVSGVTVMLAFATSTPIPHLSQALRQTHIPVEVCEIIVLIYRYAFLLLERMEIMWSAAGSRMGFSGFKRSIHTVSSIAVGMFVSSMNLADKAQIALECRGYRGYFPIYNRPPKAGLKWVAISAFVFIGFYLLGTYTSGIVDFADIFLGA